MTLLVPRVFNVGRASPDPAVLREAAKIIRDGGLVAFPTETVYGLGADATNPQAIERLNAVKGRPPDKPYALLLHAHRQVRELVPAVAPLAERLMERFWPGPLTIILPVSDARTVGIRMPDHPIALAFLEACHVPVAAPSANRSGAPPPSTGDAVLRGLDGAFDCLLDGGPTTLGRESTVVAVKQDHYEVLREGAVETDAIRRMAQGIA